MSRPNPVFSPEYAVVREAIVRARKRAGMSQRDLALRLGRSYSHVARIERGQRRVDVVHFYEIARALDVCPAGLFDELLTGT